MDKEKLIMELKQKLGGLYEFLEPFVKALEEISYGYPASRDYHHTNENGLFLHSLDVANKMLDIFFENQDEYLPRYNEEKTGAYKSRVDIFSFHLALCGLLHDIGKIGAYQIKSRWLYIPFLMSVKGIPDYELEGNKGLNYINSNHLSGFAFGILFARVGEKYYKSFLFDFKAISEMLEAIHLEHYKVLIDNPYLRILKRADGMSVAEDKGEVFIKSEELQARELDLAKIYVDLFKNWAKTTTDKFFFTGDYFLILNPILHLEFVKKVREIANEPIAEDVIIDELVSKGYTEERITTKTLKLANNKTKDFSVISIKANRVFSEEELKNKKFQRAEIITKQVNEVDL